MGTSGTIGRRVREVRKARGMTQTQLARAAGCSLDWLKSVETGRRQADRYSAIAALADALNVQVNELTAVPRQNPGDGEQQAAHMAVPRLRRVLYRAETTPGPVGVPTPLDGLRRRVSDTHRCRRQAHYGDAVTALPDLLDELGNTAALLDGDDREHAHGLLAGARHDAAMVTKKLGYIDLASIAASQALRAAQSSGDPLLVTAMVWTQAEVYLTAGAIDAAHEVTARSLDEMDSHLAGASAPGGLSDLVVEANTAAGPPSARRGPGAHGGTTNGSGAAAAALWSLWGTMHLVEAVIQARWQRQQDAYAHLAQATAAADRVGSGRSFYETEFGPENCAIHTVHIAMELGEGAKVLDRLGDVDLTGLPRERRARHGIDRALARSRDGDDVRAMEELLAADRIAPECVRNHPIAQELVTTATERAKTVKEPIALAARRMGVRL